MRKWINTKDKLPKEGKMVLTIDIHSDQEVLYLSRAYGDKGKRVWFDTVSDSIELDEITHYQELPKPPIPFKVKTINGVPNKKSIKTLYQMYQAMLEEGSYLPPPAFSWSYADKISKDRSLWICKDTAKHIEGLKLFLRSYGVQFGKYTKAVSGFHAKLEIKGFKPPSLDK